MVLFVVKSRLDAFSSICCDVFKKHVPCEQRYVRTNHLSSAKISKAEEHFLIGL